MCGGAVARYQALRVKLKQAEGDLAVAFADRDRDVNAMSTKADQGRSPRLNRRTRARTRSPATGGGSVSRRAAAELEARIRVLQRKLIEKDKRIMVRERGWSCIVGDGLVPVSVALTQSWCDTCAAQVLESDGVNAQKRDARRQATIKQLQKDKVSATKERVRAHVLQSSSVAAR